MLKKVFITIALLVDITTSGTAQVCSHPHDTLFYETGGYTIRRIDFKSPFDFFSAVRSRFNPMKGSLFVKEGEPFGKTVYDESFKVVEELVRQDTAFGGDSPLKAVVTTSGIENCREEDGLPKKLDVVYRIFATDPIRPIHATPEDRRAAVEMPATSTAEENATPHYKIQPIFSYDHTHREFGGWDVLGRIPGKLLDDFHLSAGVSSSSRMLDAQVGRSLNPQLSVIDQAEFHVGYTYTEAPAAGMRLTKGNVQARFAGFSKPMNTASTRVSVRYGASIERGLQQSTLPAANLPTDTIANSAYGAFRFYGGMTATTRYGESAISYGVQVGGTRLSTPTFAKHIGDMNYSRRFPGGTHYPWDLAARLTSGGIASSKAILLNERFFGGNVQAPFIASDSWQIPSGPLVRSIPSNRVIGEGFGGTAFYSANITVGKVLMSSPIVPLIIENAQGFASGIASAEDTIQTFFADEYESASQELQDQATYFCRTLKSDLDVLQEEFLTIRASSEIQGGLDQALAEAEQRALSAQNFIRHACAPDAKGRVNALELRTLKDPKNSKIIRLLEALPELLKLVGPRLSVELEVSKAVIEKHIDDLAIAIDTIHTGPVRKRAEFRAERDMVRPRETIDTLRHEANRFAFSLVGIFDSARIWPDPNGIRYAIGAGARFSLVNVNFTLGYAVNPHPQRILGQGQGALFFSLTYTNLFR